MKTKLWKRCTALVLAGAMTLGLTACGSKTEGDGTTTGGTTTSTSTTQTLAQELGYGYLSEYEDLSDMDLSYISSPTAAQGKLFFYGDYWDEETSENTTNLYVRDLSTGETTKVALPELQNTDNCYEYVQNLSACADGSGFWMISYRGYYGVSYDDYDDYDYDYTYEDDGEEITVTDEAAVEEATAEEAAVAEEAAEEETEAGVEDYEDDFYDDGYAYPEQEDQTLVRKCDMEGNILLEWDIAQDTADLDYFYCQSMAQGGDGSVYLVSDTDILWYDDQGNFQKIIDLSTDTGYVQSMATTGDGTVALSVMDWDVGTCSLYRLENGELSEPMALEMLSQYDTASLYPGDGSTVLLSDGTLLYSFDVNTGEYTTLLSWLDSDISGSSVEGLAANGEDTIVVLMWNFSPSLGSSYDMATLTKTPADQIPERTILTMGALYLGTMLENAVIQFNRSNDTYRVTLVDYSAYNTEDDSDAGSDQLERDIIAGNCPDILYLTTGSVQKYIKKGALADLTSLMEQDDSISMDDLVSGALTSYEADGKLYALPMGFSLDTLVGSYKLLGDRNSWTMTEMTEFVKGLDEDTEIMSYYGRTEFLNNMLYMSMGEYVDYANATCSFDSEEFQQLLELCNQFPEEYDYDSAWTGDTMEALQTGDVLVYEQYISSADEIRYFYQLYNQDNGFTTVGYPTSTGNGAKLYANSPVAISSKCQNQEGAWEFIKSLLSDENQLSWWVLPVTRSGLNQVLEEAMEQSYYTDEDGNKVPDDSIYYIGDTEYTVQPITQEQADAFVDYVNGATTVDNYDSDIMDIVTEEAEAYFSGDKSAEEVTKLIQNRVSIYLGETS